MNSTQRMALGILVLAGALLAPSGGAFANGSIGQFLVGNFQHKGSEGQLWNPTGHEAIAVYFGFGGDVVDNRDCDYALLPAKGSEQMSLDHDDHRFYVEVISVPTMGPHQGKIVNDYGIGGRWSRGNWLAVADPTKYRSRGNEFVRDCVCDALDDAALPNNLFRNAFGIKCPN